MSAPRITYLTDEPVAGGSEWERAYLAFESPAEARRKIASRLAGFGAAEWDRQARIVEIFCGSGPGLEALTELGFVNVEGMDLSAELVERYRGPAHCWLGDCRELPFDDASRDVVVVHGGLHHLEDLEALERVAREVRRVLVPGGRFCAVEPWRTLFLRAVLAAARNPLLRRSWKKLDAFQSMVENEQETYERWLSSPAEIERILRRHFHPDRFETRWGFLTFVGRRAAD